MIKKIIKITNYGRFKDLPIGKGGWSGELQKNTIFFAENGSGKTTLSHIFKSLKEDNSVISRKKTFNSIGDIEITLIDDNSKIYNYKSSKWNNHLFDIEVFDAFFAEENIYLISLGNHTTQDNFYEVIIGNEGINLKNQIEKLKIERSKTTNKKKNLIKIIKKDESDPAKRQKTNVLRKKITEYQNYWNNLNARIKHLEKTFYNLSTGVEEKLLEKINYFLQFLNPNLKLTQLNRKGYKMIYNLELLGYSVGSSSRIISLRHSLSEGDKTSLALSFFLARLYLLPELNKKIVIFDDPLSSFDYSRRSTTINQLYNLSNKVNQLIMLTHDITFAKDLSKKFCNKSLNLKIQFQSNSSEINIHNIEQETMTGIFKDLTILHNYLKNGATSDFEKREIIRCIRPVIEGIFRIKYFKVIDPKDWLGDIIGYIRNSDPNDSFYRLRNFVDELSDINDYSKEYHHSNPNYMEMPINEAELRQYVSRTLELLLQL